MLVMKIKMKKEKDINDELVVSCYITNHSDVVTQNVSNHFFSLMVFVGEEFRSTWARQFYPKFSHEAGF